MNNSVNFRCGKKQNRLALLLAFIGFICMVAAVLSVHSWVDVAVAELGETGIKSEYPRGERIAVPEAEVKVGNERYNVRPIIYYPNGRADKKTEITLDETGKYVLDYSVRKGGELYVSKKEFCVYDYLFTNENSIEPIKYLTDEKYNVTGAAFTLKPDKRLLCNKIIDVSKLTKKDTLIKIEALPETKGIGDARDLFVRLTDVYDKTNYVTIRLRRAPSMEDQDFSYITGQHHNELFSGWVLPTWFAVDHPSYGRGLKNGMRGNTDVTCPIEFRLDYGEKTLYVYDRRSGEDGYRNIVNLADEFPKNPWKGFTTGEVRLSLWAERYETDSKSFTASIMEICGCDISQNLGANSEIGFLKEEPQPVMVDFKEYSSDGNIPCAMVGHPYKVFDYSLRRPDKLSKLNYHVYYDYKSSSRYEIPVESGMFVPMRAGIYTIAYEHTDRFGNVARKFVDVKATADLGDSFGLSVPGYESHVKGTVGYPFRVVPRKDVLVENNYGTADIEIKAVCEEKGLSVVIEDDVFLPETEGDWRIVYTARDYIGRKGIFSYDADINVSDKVVYGEPENFPRYLIVGAKNYIPDIGVIDYTDEGRKKTAEKISGGTGEGSMRSISNNVFIPEAAGVYTIKYESVSKAGVTAEKLFKTRAVNVGFNKPSFSLARYFYSPDIINAVANDDNIALVAKENAEMDFIRPVDAQNFTMTFKIGTLHAVSELVFRLTDINLAGECVELHFVQGENDVVLFGINDGAGTELKQFQFSGGADIGFSIKSGRITIGSQSFDIDSYKNGDPYNGFDSLEAYLTVIAKADEGVTGNTRLFIKEISGQNFNNIDEDIVDPRIIMSKSSVTQYAIGDTITVHRAKALDIIDPYIESGLTILAPDGSSVTDIDGKTIRNAKIDEDYSFVADQIGYYKVLYIYTDAAGNGTSKGKGPSYSVVSNVPPVITLKGGARNVKAGETAALAKADIDSLSENIKVYIFYQGPVGNLKEMPKKAEDGEAGEYYFKPLTAGIYRIRYMAVDEWQNVAIADYLVKVS